MFIIHKLLYASTKTFQRKTVNVISLSANSQRQFLTRGFKKGTYLYRKTLQKIFMIFQMFWYISNIFVDSGKNYRKNKKQISIYSHFRHTFYKHLYSPLTLTLSLLIPAKMSLSILVYTEQQKQQASDCFQPTVILAGKMYSKQIVFL